MNTLISPLTPSLILATIEIGFVVVLLFNTKDRIAQIFTLIVFFHILWILSHGILHSFSLIELESFLSSTRIFTFSSANTFASFLVTLNYAALGVISASFFYFSLAYKKKKKFSLLFLGGVIVSQLSLIPLYKANSIVTSTSFVESLQQWQWEYGFLWLIFNLLLCLLWILGFYTLSKKNLCEEKKSSKTSFLFWSLVLISLLFLIVEIILPQIGCFTFDWASLPAGAMWIIFLSYIIVREKRISIQDFFVKTLLFSVSMFLIFNIVVLGFTQNLRVVFETVIKTLVFIAFTGVGRLLITNIFKESERKDQVGNLNEQLKDLNEDLEGKVAERTKELDEAKIHSETILENLTLGIIEYDESFTILRINKAAEQFLGINRHEIIGRILEPKDKENKTLVSFSLVLYPALSKEGHKIDSKEEFEQNISKNEIVIDYPKKRELQIITVPLKGLYATETPRFVKLIRDVTHEKMVDRSKSEFIKIAAHQLRTPLSGIKWAVRAILDKDLGNISKKQEEILQKTYDSNKNLIDIVNDFLNVTKIEEDFGYQKQENDIVETIKEAIL
ncbi:MAG: PAS domain S-box protein, partial [Candidatus Pacebacteria bacterium]|nr:PAS domain S-box protein [Candidatus Paceibacterota bacterium]